MSVKGKGKAYKWMLAHAEYQHDEWCLVWPFSRDRHGRGMMGHDGKHHWAHRFMCTLVHGDPPTPQHQAAHSCGHGEDGCVNPLHLDWKTPSENVTDRWKHNGYLIHTKHGTARRLVPSQARAIASAKGIRTQAELAAQFGVSENVITNIWSERTYRDDSKIAYWTPEQIEILRTSIASGMNFTQIGRAVGKPSPAVSQKAYRLGLKSGQAPTYQMIEEPLKWRKQMSDRMLVTCAKGHRSSVPADAISAPGAATYSCPVCGLGVPAEKASTLRTGWEEYAPETKRGLEEGAPSSEYWESMRCHVDEGGQLSHQNGLDLLTEVERLRAPPHG